MRSVSQGYIEMVGHLLILLVAVSLSEETQNPARVVPLAMLASVVAVSRR